MKHFYSLSAVVLSCLITNTAVAQDAPAVTVTSAKMEDLRRTTDFTGRVVSLSRVDIIARVTGFLEEIAFTEGDLVKEGDLLYRIERNSYAAAVDQVNGSIGSAEAALRLAQIEVDRNTTLVARNAVAQSELDRVTALYDQTASQIAGLKASRDQAELQLSYTTIRAPFGGIVSLSAPDVGALVGPQSGSLATLTMLDPISVEFPVATSVYLDYRKGFEGRSGGAQPTVSLILPNGDIYAEKGTVDFVSSTVNPGTDTVLLRAEFANPDGKLFDQALVRVELEEAEEDLVLAIPVQALQRDQQGYFVMTVSDASEVGRNRVTVERTAQGMAVISDGLQEGDQVITDGVAKVRTGMKVDASIAETASGNGN